MTDTPAESAEAPRTPEARCCLSCGSTFTPAAWQVEHRNFRCGPCLATIDRAKRQAAKEAGKPPPVRDPERHKKYRLRRKTGEPPCAPSSRESVEDSLRYEGVREPCEVCGAANTHAHRGDDAGVRWLCPPHHTARHKAEHVAEYMRRMEQKAAGAPEHVKKIRARRLLHHAIEKGRIVRGPCERCGALGAEGHHHDYGKPLDVCWLCPACHAAEHRALLSEGKPGGHGGK